MNTILRMVLIAIPMIAIRMMDVRIYFEMMHRSLFPCGVSNVNISAMVYDDNLFIFDDAERARVSSYIHAETFFPQKLHDKNTDFECFGDEFN